VIHSKTKLARRHAPARALAVLALAGVLVFLLPDAVAACPVCFSATEENRMAFLGTTIFLSLLPLGMVGGAGLWIRNRVRERDDEPLDRDRPRS
jgi:hypothetical protein